MFITKKKWSAMVSAVMSISDHLMMLDEEYQKLQEETTFHKLLIKLQSMRIKNIEDKKAKK